MINKYELLRIYYYSSIFAAVTLNYKAFFPGVSLTTVHKQELAQHLLTAGVTEVKCKAEGQLLVSNFSQRKYWSRDGTQEPSQASVGKT